MVGSSIDGSGSGMIGVGGFWLNMGLVYLHYKNYEL